MAMFSALRRVIKKYNRVSLPSFPSNNKKRSYGRVEVRKIASFYEIVDCICDSVEVVEAEQPIGMESVGQVCNKITTFSLHVMVNW